ncbi:MAG: peptidoglycan DD-metalloendopeptidase family protein [Gemmatimonadota bacterium]
MPDSSGWGTHVLAVEVAPDGAVWVGTFGQGIYVSRDGSGRDWEQIRSGDSTGISWDYVNAISFGPGSIWYGTIGNGWGVSHDGGKTWRNWTFSALGPRWQYVAPNGIAATNEALAIESPGGDAVYIATADGLRITRDGGETYEDFDETNGLPNRYLLGLGVRYVTHAPTHCVYVSHLRGFSESCDGGQSWQHVRDLEGLSDAGRTHPLVAAIRTRQERFRQYPAPPGGSVARPGDRAHFWFRRPIAATDNVYLDQTYTYGSTMGGNFQQHQGVEFNNPQGTPVYAAGDGVVAFAGPAEAGSNTVAILHHRRLGDAYVWTTYFHNADLTVTAGVRVRAGDLIAHVGHTGRATNDHLHVEVHTTPTSDVGAVVDPAVRFPPFTRNPQLWIEPLPGTGAIAGRVFDAAGQPVPGARIYGVSKPLPRETPFSFAEAYEDRAHPDPDFGEHFAIGDVPAGDYVLGVEIEGKRHYRAVVVAAGQVTEVEFRP